jgi:hypothetical protein
MARWMLPWLRGQLPPRYWRKVVTATAGVALLLAAADAAPQEVTHTALGVTLVLLTESFGRDVWWLWRHRAGATGEAALQAGPLRLPAP